MAVVPGIAWYEDRRGQVHCLPAQTAVPGVVALRPNGPKGSYLQLVLPSGTMAIDGRLLPMQPVDVEYGISRAADLPWQPQRPDQGVVDLSQDWRMLFREPRAFAPWGAPAEVFAEALRTCQSVRGPRPTFRAGASRREVRLLYPQIAPAHGCYRLASTASELPLRNHWVMVTAEGELLLSGPEGWTATAGVDSLGWRVVVRRGQGDPETARRVEDAVELLTSRGKVWEASAAPRRLTTSSRSLILG